MLSLRQLGICSFLLLSACSTAPTEPVPPLYRLTVIDAVGQRQILNAEATASTAATFSVSPSRSAHMPNNSIMIGERGDMYQQLPQGALNLQTGRYYQRYMNGYIDTQTGIYYQEASGGYFYDTQRGAYIRP